MTSVNLLCRRCSHVFRLEKPYHRDTGGLPCPCGAWLIAADVTYCLGADGAEISIGGCKACDPDTIEARRAIQHRAAALPEVVAALEQVESLLTNLQPHIPQACYPGREKFIDNYVDPALDQVRAALALLRSERPAGDFRDGNKDILKCHRCGNIWSVEFPLGATAACPVCERPAAVGADEGGE